jgi:hypothetical protein
MPNVFNDFGDSDAAMAGAPRSWKRAGHIAATAIREGDVERVDLTLLSIDERKLPIYLQMRRMPLCENDPWPGQPVIVAIPEGTARSRIMLPALLPAQYQKRFSTVMSRPLAIQGPAFSMPDRNACSAS